MATGHPDQRTAPARQMENSRTVPGVDCSVEHRLGNYCVMFTGRIRPIHESVTFEPSWNVNEVLKTVRQRSRSYRTARLWRCASSRNSLGRGSSRSLREVRSGLPRLASPSSLRPGATQGGPPLLGSPLDAPLAAAGPGLARGPCPRARPPLTLVGGCRWGRLGDRFGVALRCMPDSRLRAGRLAVAERAGTHL